MAKKAMSLIPRAKRWGSMHLNLSTQEYEARRLSLRQCYEIPCQSNKHITNSPQVQSTERKKLPNKIYNSKEWNTRKYCVGKDKGIILYKFGITLCLVISSQYLSLLISIKKAVLVISRDGLSDIILLSRVMEILLLWSCMTGALIHSSRS